ncbi:DUF4212 domain-containing protein [Burkholderiaceae bacterium FT117]|uniref:DUF4212 domain-containing protein n=1 Tax=Zeimonas sediminis TaxID=2944268 RepID=UPI002342CAA6|nr:DUF4212 domain-containing protein [Zeimonas sediminis]MCM5568940.1 DUF4212 domain-containing protein [Zeimonas sediminis]
MRLSARHRDYWRKSLRLTSVLLAIWFFVSFVLVFGAPWLTFDFFGWPFSFFMGAQGALLVYFAIIVFYAWRMNRMDRDYGVGEEEDY